MTICDYDHRRISFEGADCPLCEHRRVTSEQSGWNVVRNLLMERDAGPAPGWQAGFQPDRYTGLDEIVGREIAPQRWESTPGPIRLGVVIPVRDRWEALARCARGLAAQTEPAEHVVVVDCDPAPARSRQIPVRVDGTLAQRVDCPLRRWVKGTAINAGLAALPDDVTHAVLLDADMLLHPEAFARLRVWLLTSPAVAVAPLEVPMPQTERRDYGEVFAVLSQLGSLRGPDQVGGCVAYPLSWLKRTGGMDEDYIGKGYHDLDLWERARRDLPAPLYVPESEGLALHMSHPSPRNEDEIAANRRMFVERWPGAAFADGGVAPPRVTDVQVVSLGDSAWTGRVSPPVRWGAPEPLTGTVEFVAAGVPDDDPCSLPPEPFDPSIIITTYERPALLLDLLRDIDREFNSGARVRVYDDGSTADYSEVRSYLAERGWSWESGEHAGKPGFWRLLTRGLESLRGEPGPHLLMQDDLRLCEGFPDRLRAAWEALPRHDRGALQLLRQEVPSRPGRWDLSRAPRVGDAYLSGRWDCICLIGPWLLRAIDYQIRQPDPARWGRDPAAASGVDLPVIEAALGLGLRLYTIAESLVDHVEPGASLLNPDVRAEHPVYAGGYVDRDKPMVLYLGAHRQNAGWGSEGAIGRALEKHVTLLRVDYREASPSDLRVLLGQPPGSWDAVFVQNGVRLSADCMDALARHPVAFFASEAARSSLAHHRELLRRVRPATTIAHDPEIEAECARLGLRCWPMINGYDDGPYRSVGAEPETDVVFVGHLTPRRRRLLAELGALLPDRSLVVRTCHDPAVVAGLYDRARIVLHVHAGEEDYIPTRLFEALPCGGAFVSEDFGRPAPVSVPTFVRGDVRGCAEMIDGLLGETWLEGTDRMVGRLRGWREESARQQEHAAAHTWARRVEETIWPVVRAAVAAGGYFALPAEPPDVILTAYRRDHFARQIEAVRPQAATVTIWQNGGAVDLEPHRARWSDLRVVGCSENYRFHGRFALGLLGPDEDLVAIFDDDAIPGPRWLENARRCLLAHEAVVGANGRIYDPETLRQTDIGGGVPVHEDTRVDFVGHAWMVRRAWLRLMFAVEPPTWLNGEDIHLGATCAMAGIPSYVPRQPADDRDCWGDLDPGLGADDVATYKRADHRPLREAAIRYWRSQGWRLLREAT